MKNGLCILFLLLITLVSCKKNSSLELCFLTSTNNPKSWSGSIKQILTSNKKIFKIIYNNESNQTYSYDSNGRVKTIKYFYSGASSFKLDSMIYDQNGLNTMIFHSKSFDTLLYNQSKYPYRKITYWFPHTLDKIYSLAYDNNGNLITEDYILYITPDTSNATIKERYIKRMTYDNKRNPYSAYGIKGNNITSSYTSHVDSQNHYIYSYHYDSKEFPLSQLSFYSNSYGGSSKSITYYYYNCQ